LRIEEREGVLPLMTVVVLVTCPFPDDKAFESKFDNMLVSRLFSSDERTVLETVMGPFVVVLVFEEVELGDRREFRRDVSKFEEEEEVCGDEIMVLVLVVVMFLFSVFPI
jgi:hypothetical protein